jgi:NAD-dependent dihydropyrimidine dehydrogenase PreA subunit
MRKYIVLVLTLVLPIAGAVAGGLAGPLFARTHYVVRLADRVRLEETDESAGTTLESDAFRASGRKSEDLYAEGGAVERRFTLGSTILGLWCGLVFASSVFGINRTTRREIYEIDYDTCVACGRCFTSCPREQLRLKQLKEPGKKEGTQE